MADDYIRARKQTKPTKQSEDKAIDAQSNAITVGKKVMYPDTALIVLCTALEEIKKPNRAKRSAQ